MKDLTAQMHQWMTDYMKSFYNDDDKIQAAILLKEEHTGYVTRISRELAEYLQLDEHDCQLAEIMGLFHDIGRFRQFTLYQTFNDAQSEDHAELSVRVLEQSELCRELADVDRELLLFAVANHNKKAIAATQDKRKLFFARLLRDADKLDIYRVLSPFLAPSDGQGFAPGFLAKFVAGDQVDYACIQTQDDRKLVRLMWLYDVNFSWTLRQIRQRGYIDRIIACLPDIPEVAAGVSRLQDYVAAKCAATDTVNF